MSASMLRLGTRGSPLALWQARFVKARLAAIDPTVEVDLRILRTQGDDEQDRPLGPGDHGVFVRRIEQALLDDEIDLAVHSLKDLPSDPPQELELAAMLERHDPRDALLSPVAASIRELPQGAVVGTGSYRRRTQLLHARPDLTVRQLRGNVQTRIDKVDSDDYDAVMLAVAGMARLGVDPSKYHPIEFDECLPAVGQGIVTVQCRGTDPCRELLARLDHAPSREAATAERAFMRKLEGGCLAPVGALARRIDDRLELSAVVGDAEGRKLLRGRVEGAPAQADALGRQLAEMLIADGAMDLLRLAREQQEPDGAP